MGVSGYMIRSFHHVEERYGLEPIHYHKHPRRHGHDPADTPTMIVGARATHRVCSAVVYGAQVQEYRRARNL